MVFGVCVCVCVCVADYKINLSQEKQTEPQQNLNRTCGTSDQARAPASGRSNTFSSAATGKISS